MVRTIAAIVAAMLLIRPGLPGTAAKQWAAAIRTAVGTDIDPFTLLAIFWHESGLRPTLISADGEDFGLGQIRARFLSACDSTMPAAQDHSPACEAKKTQLLDPVYNINRVAQIIRSKRKACRKITGRSAKFSRWLAAYGGVSRYKGHKTVCGQRKVKGRWRDTPQHPGVRDIIQCRLSLIKGVACSRRPTARSASRRRSRARKKKKR